MTRSGRDRGPRNRVARFCRPSHFHGRPLRSNRQKYARDINFDHVCGSSGYLESAAVQLRRRNGERQRLIPDGIASRLPHFRLLLLQSLAVRQQVQLHKRICFPRKKSRVTRQDAVASHAARWR